MTCPSSCTGSCPEIVPVTINQTTITFDSDDMQVINDYFIGSDFSDNGDGTSTVTLSDTPLDAEQIDVYLNGLAQGEDTSGTQANFTLSGADLTLAFVPTVSDKIHVKYWAAA